MAKIDSVYDFSDKALVELKSWLEPWFLRKEKPGCCPPPGGIRYPDIIVANPCLEHYFRGGDLTDLKGDWVLALTTADVSGVTYPQLIPSGGPITGDDGGYVLNAGVFGVLPDDEGRVTLISGTGGTAWWTNASPWTVELWAYLDSTVTLGNSLLRLGSPENIQMNLTASSTLSASFVGSSTVTLTATLPVAAWTYVVLRYTGTTLDLLFNGAVVASSAYSHTGTVTGAITWMNNTTGSSWSPWNGRSSDLAIYHCALSDAEITAHRDAFSATGGALQGQLIVNDGAGSTSWLSIVAVQTGAPSTFTTPLVFDDTPTTGGLYGWDGSAYQQVGPPL